MKKQNIAVITGGDSSEYEVSIRSSKKIFKSIDLDRFNPYEICIVGDKWTVLNYDKEIDVNKNDFSFLLQNEKIEIDCAYLILHGAPAENGKLQAYFDMLKIPFVGCDALCSGITFNKFVCNNYIKNFDVNVANSLVVLSESDYSKQAVLDQLSFPVFVKPNEAGSSFGISKVNHADQLDAAMTKAFEEAESVIVEEFISGNEFTNGAYEIDGEVKVLPITEVVTENEFFDYEAKYVAGKAQEITPARLSSEMTQKIKEQTAKIYKYLNCSGIVRVDYIVEGEQINFLEINTIPGMTDTSFIPQQIEAEGLDFDYVINSLIEKKLAIR